MNALGKKLGLIAGNGQFPFLFARAAKAAGHTVIAVGMRGETQPLLHREVDCLTWVRVGQLRKMIRVFLGANVHQAAMAGGLSKTRLFSGARPDLLSMQLLAREAFRRDDGMLRAVAAEFERRGIRIIPSTQYMPHALAPAGVLTKHRPSKKQWCDLHDGFTTAHAIGRLDVGQAIVVHAGAVVAIEAIEGTDACIERGGALIGGGGVVVKVAKPKQDMRFDVPTIGPGTVAAMVRAGIKVLGVEAGRTLLLDPQASIEAANAADVCIVGLKQNQGAQEASSFTS